MRLIGYVTGENEAKKLSSFLQKQMIDSKFEPSMDPATGQMSYACWILEEDRIADAQQYFMQFQKNPSDPQFNIPIEIESMVKEALPQKPKKHSFTVLVLMACILVFFLNFLEEKESGAKSRVITPVQFLLFYDFPDMLGDQLDPYWHGIYDWVIAKFKAEDMRGIDGPWFIQMRKGEFWRLFSPAILHTEFFHILFNMIWLWILSRPIEERIGIKKLCLLNFLCAGFSNTVQYLVGGPFFLGYSGVIMGLAGFIYARQKNAPWEGYPLDKATLLFLMLFVGVMFILSVVSFILQMFTSIVFIPQIANAAHISGGLIGVFLGRFSFFSWGKS